MKANNVERNTHITPNNVIKRNFPRSLCVEYYCSPCSVYTVNDLEKTVRPPSIISKFALNYNTTRY